MLWRWQCLKCTEAVIPNKWSRVSLYRAYIFHVPIKWSLINKYLIIYIVSLVFLKEPKKNLETSSWLVKTFFHLKVVICMELPICSSCKIRIKQSLPNMCSCVCIYVRTDTGYWMLTDNSAWNDSRMCANLRDFNSEPCKSPRISSHFWL